MITIMFFKGIAFYEYSTKEIYLKELCDTITYKVKITGVLNYSEYNDFKTKISLLSEFNDTASQKAVRLECGEINNLGEIANIREYTPGYQLKKGDIFGISLRSSKVCNYSRLENWGVSTDDSNNLYFYAKGICRVEEIFQ
jgi:hypothetical protein